MNNTVKLVTTSIIIVIASVIATVLSVSFGPRDIPLSTVIDALLNYDTSIFDHLVIQELRLPRVWMAATVGASLAISGALLQGGTRNPLADPSLLGMMAGAAFFVVLSRLLIGEQITYWLPVIAGAGALLSAVLVWSIATRTKAGATPLVLLLAGSAVSAFLAASTTFIQLADISTFEEMRVWLVGSLAGVKMSQFNYTLPWVVIGMIAALRLSPAVTMLSMGDDTATGLGIDVVKIRRQLLITVIILTAAAVSLAGPIGFIALTVPHSVKFFTGPDYRKVIPWSALVGAIYLVVADTLARVILAPREIATGLITVIIGAPIFIALIRTKVKV